MPTIRGIEFIEEAVHPVQELIRRIEEMASASSFHPKYGRLCFALHTPNPTRKKARGIFVMIKAVPQGARVSRPAIPTFGQRRYDLLSDGVDTVFEVIKIWYGEVQGTKPPTGFQSTEAPNVLAGGQFESNKKKH